MGTTSLFLQLLRVYLLKLPRQLRGKFLLQRILGFSYSFSWWPRVSETNYIRHRPVTFLESSQSPSSSGHFMRVEGTSLLARERREGEGERWALVVPRMRSEDARLSLNMECRISPTAYPLSINDWVSSASDSGRLVRSTSVAHTRSMRDRVSIVESRDESAAWWVLLLPVFTDNLPCPI